MAIETMRYASASAEVRELIWAREKFIEHGVDAETVYEATGLRFQALEVERLR